MNWDFIIDRHTWIGLWNTFDDGNRIHCVNMMIQHMLSMTTIVTEVIVMIQRTAMSVMIQ